MGLCAEEEPAGSDGQELPELPSPTITWPAVAIREDPPEEHRDAPATVDCDARIHVCKAVCCRLKFPLSTAEIEEAIVKWDIGHPYLIRHESDGYCTHNDRSAHGCTVYERRPTVCRTYSCVGDKRIWADFDAMELNHAWIEEHLGGDDGMYFDSVVASMEVPVELTRKPT
jgi:Fe-S-cluster containining protein